LILLIFFKYIDGISKVICLAGVRVSTGGGDPVINGVLSWIEVE
jgi:hypothetical protein